jgi:Cu/Ag efflux protein CusF
MKKTYSLVLAAAIAVFAGSALAEEKAAAPAADKPGGIAVQTTTTTSTVTAIDYKARTFTLKGENGESVTLNAGPEVKNFPQLKKGDTVTVETVESIGIFVTPKGQVAPSAGKTQYLQTAKPGQKPGMVAVQTETVTATVTAIDYNTRMVTLKGPAGNTRTVKVGPEAKRLNEVKVGDEVTVTVTVGTAIAVTTPQKKK